MMARVMFRIFDRHRRIDEHIKMRVDTEIGALCSYGRHSVRRLSAATGIDVDVTPADLAAAADQLCHDLHASPDAHRACTRLLANGWVLHARIDQREQGDQDEPMLPLVVDYDKAA